MDTLLSNQSSTENRANSYLARTIHVKPIQFPFLTGQMAQWIKKKKAADVTFLL